MKKFIIKDRAGNYPFNKYIKQTINGPDCGWESFDDAEDFLSEFLGDNYDELREEYFIEESP